MPEGWCWCKIGDIAIVARGGSPRPIENYLTTDSSGVNWIKIGDAEQGGKYINSTKQRITHDGVSRSRIVHAGDFLLTNSMSFGRPYILNIEGCIHDGWLVISPLQGVINKDFFFYLLSSDFAYQQFSEQASGAVVSNLNKDKVAEAYIPLPPVREQAIIVKAIEAIDLRIEKIEHEQCSLFTTLSFSKGKILDLAIHGKLVPQDPSDEPAIELLKRINPDFAPSDNLHYEGVLPIGWSLTRLGDVIDIISGTSYQKSDIVQIKSGIRILRGGNIQNGKIVLRDDDVFVHERLSATYLSPCRGDIALVASTGSSELIGKSAIAEIDYPNTQIGAFLRIIRPKAIELAEYLGVIFQSNYYKNHIRDVAKGTNINNIKSIYITDFVVPIPPIDEQRRILQHLKALFTIANQISDSIDESK